MTLKDIEKFEAVETLLGDWGKRIANECQEFYKAMQSYIEVRMLFNQLVDKELEDLEEKNKN